MKRIKLTIKEVAIIDRVVSYELFINDEDLPKEGLHTLEESTEDLEVLGKLREDLIGDLESSWDVNVIVLEAKVKYET